YVEWAGPAMQSTVVGWRMIDGADAARDFAAELAKAPIQSFRGTSISGGLSFAMSWLEKSGYEAPRRVIDVSGDGANNMGMPVEVARQAVLHAGIVINGLPIMMKESAGFGSLSNLDVYYEDCVIGGAGAFMVVVRSADQFAEAIRRKLVMEIAAR